MRLPRVRVPRVRDIKTKLSSARLLGGVVKNSLQFKLRRRAFRRFSAKDFDTIIVDMDGTLYESDANLEALKVAYPEKNESGVTRGEELYDFLISKIVLGEYSIERAIIEGNRLLMKAGVGASDIDRVLARVNKGLRKQLIRALKELKKNGKKVVLATLSSKNFGERLNVYLKEKYGFSFDYIAGTELRFNSEAKISGLNSIVGTKDFEIDGIKVKSKVSAIKEELALAGIELDVGRTVLITDSYGDIDSAKMFVTILIKPDKPTQAQKVSHQLRLADYILPDDADLQTNLLSIILGPEKN
ncbi:MAG: haloacid dehalogenase-like hydrolase [archaeon]|nr:haloacid dehalogenase-like hydrolase [archaeon]